MATVLLSAAGAAAGSAIGGSVMGLSAAVVGRAVGATIGRVIDQQVLGAGSDPVEVGRIERFRLTGASEGDAIGRIWGRARVGGQVIWATRFNEHVTESGGGKGGPSQPKTRNYTYSVSLAVALCEGEISGVGRIWADGVEIAKDRLDLRVYTGDDAQLPDPLMEAVEGAGRVPSYRGIAYVVIENLDLGDFGNRVPQFSFELARPAAPISADIADRSAADLVRAVAVMPGTGEYALATTPVHFEDGLAERVTANQNSPSGKSDFATSLDQLVQEVPQCSAASMIVSWFGNDLRAGACSLRPMVDRSDRDGVGMPWRSGGIGRVEAAEVPKEDGRAIYGGTPADASVLEAMTALAAAGKRVMFYPFILLDQLDGNGLPDPYGGVEQPRLPWRGRITSDVAPGLAGDPDGTAAVDAQVAAFFGDALPSDFTIVNNQVHYSGPAEWSYRRFILHYAHLCALSGQADAFCIGSEMRGLTTLRGASGYPAVQALRDLAADVRGVLGPAVKIGYAADWSEYFGHHDPSGSGEMAFHLDPLWADPAIDFIGIDNYMPLSDWRDTEEHADKGAGSIYALDYLSGNVAGGEGYDWYYADAADRDAQQRSPITDGAGEPWVWRYKDLLNWWSNPHHDRPGGVRNGSPTAWVPRSKPIWFTELGCAAIDKGTNQPNKFLDPKSSESALPYYSTGARDDLIQAQYLRAMVQHWSDPSHNPVSPIYGGPMVDMDNAYVWAWDARPFPQFPASSDLWTDAENYARGHWLNGRVQSQALGAVVREICESSGLHDLDVSGLYGLVRGYTVDNPDHARAALQPLMLAYGFEAAERDGQVRFQMRAGRPAQALTREDLVAGVEEGDIVQRRSAAAEMSGRVRLSYVAGERDYAARVAEAILPGEASGPVSRSELPLALTAGEAVAIVERWLMEARIARETVRFALPPSRGDIGAGDVVTLPGADGVARYRVDSVEVTGPRLLQGTRVEDEVYTPAPVDVAADPPPTRAAAPMPVAFQFLDLPLLRGDEVEHAPHVAAMALPWPGRITVQSSSQDAGYEEVAGIETPVPMGETLTDLPFAAPGAWDLGPGVELRLRGAVLSSADRRSVLNGANALAIGDGSSDAWEVLQFAEAELIGPDTYRLRHLLRGQQGTDAVAPPVWPAGSRVVLLRPGIPQVDLPASLRGVERHYRVGPAGAALDSTAFTHVTAAFAGIGLRPYAPCHLRAARDGGDRVFQWIRRTRVDGDSWDGAEVPLAEESERYAVRVIAGGTVLRTEEVASASWRYTAADQAVDGLSPPFALDVAQISARFGVGPFKRIEIND